MQRRTFWTWALIAGLLFIGSFIYSYGRIEPPKLLPNQGKSGDQDAVSLGSEALVTLHYVLADGRRAGEEHIKPITAGIEGATLEDLHKAYPAWSVLKFGSEELVAEVRCNKQTGGYLGEKDGWVAVFEGNAGPCSVLRELTDIPVTSVRSEERDRLAQRNMRFTNEDNLQELIDGLIGD